MSGRGRVTATTIGVLVIVFASGVTVGRAWDVRAAEAGVAQQDTPEAGEARDGGREGQRRRRQPMYEQVGITDAQRVVIDSLVVHYRTGMRAFQRESRAEYEAGQDSLIRATREAILSVMTPEQAQEYQSLLDANDERRRERREQGADDEEGRGTGDGAAGERGGGDEG